MSNIFLGIITLAAVVLVVYVVYMILNLKRTIASLERFVETTGRPSSLHWRNCRQP